MKEVRFFYVPDAAQVNELPADEAMHAMRVLRLKGGDELFLMDGVGNFYRAQVTIAATHHCYYEILEVLPQERQWKGHFHLAIAPTKMMDRIEWMVEKATEVGVDEISFLNCAFSERRVVKNPRIEKIIVSAMKQSHKAWKPVLNEMSTFAHFIEQPRAGVKYIAHCYDEIPRVNLFDELRKTPDETEMTVLVGPEGDFSIDEVRQAVDHGYQSVSLGTSRLRTETAGLSAVMMMQLSKQ
ncbi:MAG: 16S rRNA (uracil(1498)-N(3))-methyltransferase [Prevotella sp.]|jgi:16S rRNA (uracil1498-N3)-methyltransferase|nr:16S rRNA (uracil(1498)-N(3))-methyltransferase [Prevotella sp.]